MTRQCGVKQRLRSRGPERVTRSMPSFFMLIWARVGPRHTRGARAVAGPRPNVNLGANAHRAHRKRAACTGAARRTRHLPRRARAPSALAVARAVRLSASSSSSLRPSRATASNHHSMLVHTAHSGPQEPDYHALISTHIMLAVRHAQACHVAHALPATDHWALRAARVPCRSRPCCSPL